MILATIIGLAFISRKWMNIITVAWVAFTLLGSIYTLGLLLLQLLTIAIAYLIGRLVIQMRRGPSAG